MIATLRNVMLRYLRSGVRPIRTAADLERFLMEQSAFVSQKSVVEYCRIKAGVRWQKLFGELAFKEALERSRFASMRAVLCDLAVIVEGSLREAARPNEMALADALANIAQSILAAYDRGPAWQSENAIVIDELRRRLARAQMAAPLAPDRVARTAGAIVFDALPVHSMLRSHDREVIVNNIRFGTVRFWETLCARLDDRAELARNLVGAPTASHA